MNRQEALEKLENYFYWNYYDEEYDREVEEKHKQNLEDIIKYLKQPITLTDFLGWKEDVEYDYRGEQYKIFDNQLYYFDNRYNEWITSIFNEEFIGFQQAKKIQPEKYYLRLKGKYCKFYGIAKNFVYLNFDTKTNTFFLAGSKKYKYYETQFTKEEIEEIERLLKDNVERHCTSIDIKKLEILKEILKKASNSKSNISISTIHSSKGLEYDNVFIIDLVDGEFPQKSVLNSFDEKLLEEERRLFYVAMTRAKKRLFLFTIKERNNLPVEPSIFYNELKNKNPTLP